MGLLKSQPSLSLPSSCPYLLVHDVPTADEYLLLMPAYKCVGVVFLQGIGVGL